MIETLDDILAAEFTALRARGEATDIDFTKKSSWARFLDVSEGHLSKVRGGTQPLTTELARQWAQKLRGEDPLASDRLKHRLIMAAVPKVTNIEDIESGFARRSAVQLFHYLAEPNSFMFVDYRDLPRAAPRSPYPAMASLAGRSIAHGLCFAMVQPFGNAMPTRSLGPAGIITTPGQTYPTTAVRGYLEQLILNVRKVYAAMRDAAVDAYLDLHELDHEDDAAVAKARKVIAGRIVLYERDRTVGIGTGIQSRVFYVQAGRDERVFHRAFEWVGAEPEDYFIVRDRDNSLNPEALGMQIAPILHYWELHRTLPETNRKLTDAVIGYASGVDDGGDFGQESPWTVYGDEGKP